MSDAPIDDPRKAAISRLKAKRQLRTSAATFVILSVFFIVIWAVGDRGYFWPAWPIAAFALALAFQWWAAYKTKPITEADIQREMGNDT